MQISKQPNTAENKKSRKPLKTKAFGVVCGAPEGTRIPDLPLRSYNLSSNPVSTEAKESQYFQGFPALRSQFA